MLKQRLIFGILGIILALGVLLLCSPLVIGLCVAVISLIGMGEFYKVTGRFSKKSPVCFVGFLFAIVVFVMFIFLKDLQSAYLLPLITGYIFFLMTVMVLFRNKCLFSDIAYSFMGTSYITVFFLHIILIRQGSLGHLNIWLIFISAWATDTFAYFAGRAFGKHKLCPTISPKKTVEGAIGGILGCIICICLYAFFCQKFGGVSVNYLYAIVLACITSIVSQIGDLAASCIKRENNVKDYGNLIPGHGGILDRFDSALLISPVVYYFVQYLPVIF